MKYESRGDDTFNELVEEAGSAERENEGWFVYTWENGTLNVSNSYGKWLNVRGMISATSGGVNSIFKKKLILWAQEKQTCEVNA